MIEVRFLSIAGLSDRSSAALVVIPVFWIDSAFFLSVLSSLL
jgi:hypothetical protein